MMCQFPGKPDAVDQFSDRLKERGWTDDQIVKMSDKLKARDQARSESDKLRTSWEKACGVKVNSEKWPHAWSASLRGKRLNG